MKTILHKSNERGKANHGWLDSNFSFSFGPYYNPLKTNFGLLRVLNDDVIAADRGFGTHPHDNMEIISIPIYGQLKHKDNAGHESVISENEIQVMSAGSGIQHSEFNPSSTQEANFLQIWIFPNKQNVEPRYDQQKIPTDIKNEFYQILSPNRDDDGVWIHQNTWMQFLDTTEDTSITYNIEGESNGVYVFMIKGEAKIGGENLNLRDALGVWETDSFSLDVKANSRILTIEVPMH
jgi:redox-sensitive bicupin YhaK (pirin superfamily)